MLFLCSVVLLALFGHSLAESQAWQGYVANLPEAKAYVESRFSWEPSFLCTGSRIYGLMKKEALQIRWPVSQKLAGEVMVFHKHKIVFIRQPKSSSSTIRALIIELLCEGQRPVPGHCWKQGNTFTAPEQWMDYFVFTWVRNPLARMASCYTYFNASMYRMLPGNGKGEKCTSQSFEDFSVRAIGQSEGCKRKRCCSNMYGLWRSALYVSQHVSSMHRSTFNATGASAVDFIGRTENLEEDWKELVTTHLSRFTGSSLPLKEMHSVNRQPGSGESSLQCDGLRYASLYDDTLAHNMAMQMAIDMQLFGFV